MQWTRKEMEPNLVDILIDGMETALNEQYREQMDDFLLRHNADKWIIASDYSMGRQEFRVNTMRKYGFGAPDKELYYPN